MSEDIENLNSPNQAEGTENQDVEETEADEESEDVSKLQELNRKLYERAKKAEAEAKKLKEVKAEVKPEAKPESKPESDSLSQKDLIAIIRANVSDEDVAEVADYAALKKISVAEALKSPLVKSILKEKEEERKSAQVANTGQTRKSASKVSDDQLLANVRAGKVEISDADMERLILARRAEKN